jgi:hypothetical protein
MLQGGGCERKSLSEDNIRRLARAPTFLCPNLARSLQSRFAGWLDEPIGRIKMAAPICAALFDSTLSYAEEEEDHVRDTMATV